ncbi:hypothetical protein [Fulvivirga lutea]|uniref:Uncharacterized protein n=1 Tax=Fulvivirga lutea TaxID=2810512 RepID=A0A975A173_9BACT|nr:hypothetical protein [Fulvivirga lutea]QSE97930.1 hypothetical protein JR347_02245 [Fulvivirga lutea]
MKLFLHVKIIENNFDFKPGLTFSNATCSDLDNYSSPEVIATVLKALNLSEKLFVYFELNENSNAGSLLKVIQELRSYKKPMQIRYSGESNLLEKLILKLGGKPIDKEALEAEVGSFFN